MEIQETHRVSFYSSAFHLGVAGGELRMALPKSLNVEASPVLTTNSISHPLLEAAEGQIEKVRALKVNKVTWL